MIFKEIQENHENPQFLENNNPRVPVVAIARSIVKPMENIGLLGPGNAIGARIVEMQDFIRIPQFSWNPIGFL